MAMKTCVCKIADCLKNLKDALNLEILQIV